MRQYKLTMTSTEVMVLIVLSVSLTASALWLSFSQDDAFIIYRYASNLLHGQGLVYNYGEWVEGYTCPLWVLILAAIGGVGLNMVVWSKVLGVCLAVATLWMLFIVSKKVTAEDDQWWVALIAPLMLALNPSFASFVTSGLETALFAFLLTVTTAGFIYSLHRGMFSVWLALGYVFLTMTRPEGLLMFAVAWILGWFHAGGRFQTRLSSLAAYLLPIAAVTVLRWIIYGYPFPNPAYSKLILDRQALAYGMNYVWRFLVEYGWFGILLVLAILPVIIRNDSRKMWRYLGILFLAYVIYILFVGGDVLKGLRFFVPILPIYALLIQGGIMAIWKRMTSANNRTAGIVIVTGIVAVVVIGQAAGYPRELHRAQLENGLVEKMRTLANWFREHQPSNTAVAANSIGALGYYSGYRMVDMVGLVNAAIAHHPRIIKGIHSPTRERTYNAEHVLEQHPDFIVFDTYDKPNHAGDFALYLHSDFREGYYRYPIWMPGRDREMLVFKEKPAGWDTTSTGQIRPDEVDSNTTFVYALREGMIAVDTNPDKAEKDFQEVLDTAPQDFAQPWEWLGMLALGHGNRSKADSLFQRAVEIDSFSVYAIRYLAKIAYNNGNMDDAMRWAQDLLRIDPDIPDGWLMTGWILKEREQKEAAVSTWKDGIARLGDQPDLIGVLKSIEQ
jgi:arabinofuranosyltransferase